MHMRSRARPRAWRQEGRAGGAAVASGHPHFTPTAIAVHKRGRPCVIGKLVLARPLGQIVLAMPYRHRQSVEHVSIPPRVLAFARKQGAWWWVVRLDADGECYGLPIAQVEAVGWLQRSDGCPEWFVPLAKFKALAWQDWEYVEGVTHLDADPPNARQLPLLPEAAYAG